MDRASSSPQAGKRQAAAILAAGVRSSGRGQARILDSAGAIQHLTV